MGPSVMVLMRFDCNLDDSDDMELIEKVSQHGTYELAWPLFSWIYWPSSKIGGQLYIWLHKSNFTVKFYFSIS